MKKIPLRLLDHLTNALWLVALLTAVPAANASILHRYSFDGAQGSTTVTDSVGAANGTVVNGTANAGLNGSGQLILDGNQSSAYVSLPSGILPQLTNATFETWVTDANPQTWAELWTFGTNNGSTGQQYLSFIPVDGGLAGQIGLDNGHGAVAGGILPANQAVLLTAVYNFSAGTASIYMNGVKTGSGALTFPINTIPDPDNYIGQSQYYGAGDPYFTGTVDEFRIYNNVLSPAQIEANFEAGPNVANASPGNLTSLQFGNSTNVFIGSSFPPILLGVYSSLTNHVNLTGESNITYSSDNTNVLAFGTDGSFHATGLGTTTIRASFQSFNAALAITVVLQPTVLLHRYSFNGAQGSTTVTDSVGNANGTVINGTANAGLNGSGQLVLDGNQSSAYVSLPSGILPQLTNATFEIWTTDASPQTWAELWTFGTNNGTAGQQYLSLIPQDGGLSGQIGLDNGHGAIAGGPIPVNQAICLSAVYNFSGGTASLYVNGVKTGSGAVSFPINTIPDPDNHIGQSQYFGGGDPYFTGTVDEFRIYSGVQSDLQLAIDAAAGPNNIITNTGALLSLVVTSPNTNVDAHAASVPIQVIANFANVTNVLVTSLAQTTFSSSDTSVGIVTNGTFEPQNAGVATVKASYNGLSGSLAFSVADSNAWPSLLHRWRFNEPAGSTTITDSIGNINATVHGPATFDGKGMQTITNNPASNSGGNGVPATNGVWAEFPGSEGIVTGLPNEASFEIWVTWYGGNVWQEMFDFGQAATPGFSGTGFQYVMISPFDGANSKLRAEWDQNPGYDVTIIAPTPLTIGQLSQVVYTHDQDRQLDKLYLNGQLVGSAANTALWSTLPDTDNWLARDEWPDAMFSGEYWDFRMWNGALTSGQVADLFQAGSEVVAGPALKIAAGSGNQITLQWPANATAFTLQTTTDLAGGTWAAVPGTPTVINGLNNLSVTRNASGPGFYRLKQ